MKTIYALIIFGAISFITQAQNPLSLNDAIQNALDNNYGIQISISKQEISTIQNSWGAAGRYPYINLTGNADNSKNMNDTEDFISNRFIGEASINWTIFDGFAVKINKTRFEELEQLSKQNTAIMVESTIQSVVLAYYDALLQKEKLNTYQEVMTLSEDRYKQTKVSKDLGTAVTYHLLQAQNAYLADRSDYLLQEVTYKNALRDLNYLMADKSEVNYQLTDEFKAIPVDYAISDLQAQMQNNNKSLQNQYVNQRLLQNAVASAKSAFMPTLSFKGGAQYNSTRNDYEVRGESWINASKIYGNFTLSFNLFSGGNKKRALQIARIEEEVGTVEMNDIKHDLNNSLVNIYELFLVRKELLNVANENMEAAKLNLQISQDKFDSGTINSFNFRDVQNIYLNASQKKLEAIYKYIDTHTALLRMVGVIVQEYE